MIIEHLKMGGIWFMLPIYLLWLAVIVLSVITISKAIVKKTDNSKLSKQNNLIMFLGSFAFLLGILGQVLGLMGAFDAIHAAGDVSPALLVMGIKVSMLAPVYGFVLMIVSSTIWFINRNYLIEKA